MLTFTELAILALAGYRATQLAVHDSILDSTRDRLHARLEPTRTLTAPDGHIRITMRPLRGPNAGRITEEIERKLSDHPAVTSAIVDRSRGEITIATAPTPGVKRALADELLATVEEIERAHGVRGPRSVITRMALTTLIACTYCAGWWISGAILAAWLLATDQWDRAPLLVHGTPWDWPPLLVHGIEWFAVAGGQALLNRWDDTRPSGA